MGLWQPCDVGIQHMLKLAVKHSQQTTVIHEVYSQMQQGVGPCEISLDMRLGTLRDSVPTTLVDAHHMINIPMQILKVNYSLH